MLEKSNSYSMWKQTLADFNYGPRGGTSSFRILLLRRREINLYNRLKIGYYDFICDVVAGYDANPQRLLTAWRSCVRNHFNNRRVLATFVESKWLRPLQTSVRGLLQASWDSQGWKTSLRSVRSVKREFLAKEISYVAKDIINASWCSSERHEFILEI